MAVTEEISPLDKKIIRQVEHYFGDFNLTKDKFLQETVKENDGWVDMDTMLKFKRLAALTTDTKQIIAALKKSSSGLMEINEEGEGAGKIRRSPDHPVPENNEENKKKQEARTAYAKGYDKEKTTMDELLEYYTEHEPSIIHVQMRNYMDNKTKTKAFKGSVFLTFRTEEDCKAFLEKEGGQQYKDNKLESIMYQKDYFAMKAKEYEEKKNKKNKKNADKKENTEKVERKEEKEDDYALPKGATIKITGLGGEITREDLKEKLNTDFGVNISKESDGEVAFVTYQKGEEEAKIRFKAENFGKDLMEKMNKLDKLVIKDMEVKASLLEGEEETKYLEETLQEMKNMRNKNRNHKRKSYGKGGGHAKKMRKE